MWYHGEGAVVGCVGYVGERVLVEGVRYPGDVVVGGGVRGRGDVPVVGGVRYRGDAVVPRALGTAEIPRELRVAVRGERGVVLHVLVPVLGGLVPVLAGGLGREEVGVTIGGLLPAFGLWDAE